MDVVYLSSINKPSGAGTHAKLLMEELATRDGIDLTAMQGQQTGWPETFITEGDDPDLELDLPYDWVFPHNIEEALIARDPDAVIVHVFNTQLFDVLESVSEQTDITFILRHGTNLYEQWVNRWRGQNETLSSVSEVVWGLDWFDAIICPTQTVADRLQLYYGDDCPQLFAIPNGINLDEFVPTTYRNTDEFRVVVASRPVANNYLALPILAARRLVEDIPIKLRVYGGGDAESERLIGTCQRLAGDTGDIEFWGQTDREVVIRALEQADVACVPSMSHNAVPYAALEGLAAGCLVIASDCAAIREEPTIIRASPEDPTTWYEALWDAYHDAEDVKEIVRDGLQAAREYNVERIVSEGYLPLLEQVADE